jgi:HSP20 family protein
MPSGRLRASIESKRRNERGGSTMSIVKWTLFNELDPLELRASRRVLEGTGFAPMPLPAADVYETAEEYVVTLDVPGYEEKELRVEVSDHMLAIKGQRAKASDEQEKAFALRERLERKFERRFTLPVRADTEHVKATFVKGVLEIRTPKRRGTESKTVTITRG